MNWLSEMEECVLINTSEMSQVWSVAADWTESENEDEWLLVAPKLAEIISSWSRAGYIEVYRGNEWPAHEAGHPVSGADLQTLLSNPATWAYEENLRVVISLAATAKTRELSIPPEER